MKYLVLFSFLILGNCVNAQNIAQHKGAQRVLMVFTPSLNNDDFQAQYEIFSVGAEGFTKRDLFTYNISEDNVFDQSGKTFGIDASEAMRKEYKVKFDEYTIIIIGKNGNELLRQNEPISLGDLFGMIDKLSHK